MTAHAQSPDLTVHARIDDTGAVDLTVEGLASRAQESSVEDARQLVTRRAWDLAVRHGRDVTLHTSDPDGSWVFVVRPDGTVVEPQQAWSDQPVEPAPPTWADEPTYAEPSPVAVDAPADPGGWQDAQQPAARLTDEAPGPERTRQPGVTPPGDAAPEETAPYELDGRAEHGGALPVAPPPAAVPFGAPSSDLAPVAGPPTSPVSWAPQPPAPPVSWQPQPLAVPVTSASPPAARTAPSASPEPRATRSRPPEPGTSAPRRQSPPEPEPAPPVTPRRALPTLDDLLESRPTPPPGPATTGWRGAVRRASFGLVAPRPSEAELAHRAAVATIQRSLSGPRTVVVVNPKGGASKTTATMLLAATFATHRGGYTLAWDNNETRGTLGWRALPSRHTNTAVDLLADLSRFQEVRRARVGDLDNYVRSQGAAQFDVLASDEDASASASIDADAFNRLHATLSRFYRVLVIDTGNNMRASNWDAAVRAADQLVIVSTQREDTAASAAWLIDGLRSKGFEDKVAHAVTVLTAPSDVTDSALTARLHDHFGQLTRMVVDVPHDPALVAGGTIDVARLSPATREAWIGVTAAVADGL